MAIKRVTGKNIITSTAVSKRQWPLIVGVESWENILRVGTWRIDVPGEAKARTTNFAKAAVMAGRTRGLKVAWLKISQGTVQITVTPIEE